MLFISHCICGLILASLSECLRFETHVKHNSSIEAWTGKWFPHEPTTPSTLDTATKSHHDGRIPMGVANPDCDDGIVNLETDWYDDTINYTCFNFDSLYEPNENVRPIYDIETIPPAYMADHACMNESIEYSSIIPTFGTHRPLWAKWGEYTFLPKQRWLHNMEHGGLVMLYHPCANDVEVDKLRNLVEKCLYRHIITPYNLLPTDRPLALVAWGRKLQMSMVSPKIVVDFIKEAALKGPEHTAKNGQYSHALIKNASIVTDESDKELCPNL